ncbi:MAG: ABC transporter ATP-binding protein [Euryarchaeota archaeon]|nr:ABC transporter ATP-binding protein [Euryarchaeota archaeon]
MIATERLTKIYNTGGSEIKAVRGVSLRVEKGEFISIVGHSGSGKTTLLSMIGGLTRPTYGRVLIDGVDIWAMSDEELSRFRNRKIGFMFQFSSLISTLTVRDNMLLPAALSGKVEQQHEERALELLERLGLEHRAGAYPAQLSGGEQRRVAVARAFMNRPEIILADEPTGDLDEESEEQVMELLTHMNREEGVTILLVTHNLELAARTRRTLRMRRGRLEER